MRGLAPLVVLIIAVACTSPGASTSSPPSRPTPAVLANGRPTVLCLYPMTGFGGFLCRDATSAVEQAISGMGVPVQIAFHEGAICLDDPSSTRPCAMPTPPGFDGVDSAIVDFAGTTQRAYINLYFPTSNRNHTITTELLLTP